MTTKRLRLAVFCSNKHIYAQIIDDEAGKTLVSTSEKDLRPGEKGTKTERARLLGKVLGQKAIKKRLKYLKFDRRALKYHGRVKALAEGAREEGLEF